MASMPGPQAKPEGVWTSLGVGGRVAPGLKHRKVIPRLHETQSLKARQEEVSRRDNESAVGMSRQETPTLWPALGSRVNTHRGKGATSSPENLEVNTTRGDPQKSGGRSSRKWFLWEAELKAVFCVLLTIC